MNCFRAYKKIVLSVSIVAFVFLFASILYYFHKTNIISTIEIKISSPDVNLISQINVKAFGPLDRSFDVIYSKASKSWNTQELYLNRLEITFPKSINKNDSFSITINGKMLETYKSGINTSIIGNNLQITIDEIFSINFAEKFVYFIHFYFNRLIEIKIHFKKYLTFIIYLSMLIAVFIKAKTIQKKQSTKSHSENNEN